MNGFEDIAQINWLVTWEYLFDEEVDFTQEHDIAADEFASELRESLSRVFTNAEIFTMSDGAQYAQWHSRIYANDDVPWDRIDAAYDMALELQDDLFASEWWEQRVAQIAPAVEEVA